MLNRYVLKYLILMVLYGLHRTNVQTVPLIGDALFGLSHTLHHSAVVVCATRLYRKHLPRNSTQISRRNKASFPEISWSKQNVGSDTRCANRSRTCRILTNETFLPWHLSHNSMVDDCYLLWVWSATWWLDQIVRKATDRHCTGWEMVGGENRLPRGVVSALDHNIWFIATFLLPGTTPVLWLSTRPRKATIL